MDRSETLKILSILRAAYPGFCQAGDLKDTAALWQAMFRSDSYEDVSAAVYRFIEGDEKGRPPHVGAIKAYMRKAREEADPLLTPAQAWAIVSRAASNGIYGAEDEFQRLPEELRYFVGSPARLKSWAMMDRSELETVVASTFLRSFREDEVKIRRSEASCLLPARERPLLPYPAIDN